MDHGYMAQILANLSNLPVRLYENGKFLSLYHTAKFKPDLAILEEEHIFQSKDTVSYYMTDTFLIYGLFRVKGENINYLIGPIPMIKMDRKAIRSILRSIGEPMSREDELFSFLSAIPSYPIHSFLQILCAFDYFLNGEKKSVDELLLHFELEDKPPKQETQQIWDPTGSLVLNTYELEQQLLSMISHGQIDAMAELLHTPPMGAAGSLASDALRQQKNTFICTATLVSRAAIRGGLSVETAFALSDVYIQKAELLHSCTDVINLQAKMVIDYTHRVHEATSGELANADIRTIRNYILLHISRRVTTEELASLLGVNRTYLTALIKNETGVTPAVYITKVKLEKACQLLTVSNKSLGEIAYALGFSSQSHFQNVFKKEMGITPLMYRNK